MTCELMSWCALPADAQAAWVQAIGTIVAIVAAIFVGVFQARSSRELVEDERRRQAKITATGLALSFEEVKAEAAAKASIFRSYLVKIPQDPGVSTTIQADALFARLQLASAYTLAVVPQQALSFDEHAGKIVIMAAARAQSYNRHLYEALLSSGREWLVSELYGLHEEVIGRLERIVDASDQAITVLMDVHSIRMPSTGAQ